MAQVSSTMYGKDNVRVFKVHRNEETGVQTVVEMTVCVLLEGEIETSYTQADNSVVVATDTMKNTVYIMAKQHPVTPPEFFASIVSNHFIETYKHIHAAHVKVITHRWTRMTIDGQPHPHSFLRDGSETRTVEAAAREGRGISMRSGIAGLLVLKSTGSQFHSFVRDEYTTLPEVHDRILSTEVDANWLWRKFPGLEAVKSSVPKFDAAWDAARTITLKTFAREQSASVQNTMYKMCEQILAAVPEVDAVDYSLPNKHYFEIDLSWHKGLKNTGKDAEIYAPQSNPNGLIQCTVTRPGKASNL
ncbi:MAG: hypothetical protein M1827_005895 [Pycnora praestabilis]|nr:MAG: hypothetical protein M1827_005895 [Pycnora praestabilis]